MAKRKRGDTISVANLLTQTPPKMPSFCGCLPQSWVSHLRGLFSGDIMAKMKTHKEGTRFGRLVVIEFCGTDDYGHSLSRCLCDCGNEVTAVNGQLTAGRKKSCGCLSKDNPPPVNRTHGRSKEGVYKVWCQMWRRCDNPNNANYHLYGGKGVRVCERWRSFEAFIEDMGERPDKHTIERRESSGDYEPSNCYWATRVVQNNNTSRNRHVTIGDRTMTVSQWARETGIHKSTITARLNRGISGVELLCVQ